MTAGTNTTEAPAARRGTQRIFLLSPADIDVSADERRRIAEAGFYAYQ